MEIGPLIGQIRAAQTGTDRLIVAIIGAPASGKSTLTEALCEQLGGDTAIVPMDGFHFDDGILKERGLLTRKGAPDTFDVGGLKRILATLREGAEDDVYVPLFDRKLEISRGSARVISRHHRVILVEGNYLLLDQAPWDQLAGLFDLSIYLEVPEETLRARLLDRWHGLGFDRQTAITKAEHNDLPNALTVTRHSKPADITLTNG